jgi:hypothetical protein
MRRFALAAGIVALTAGLSAQMGAAEQQVIQAEKDRFAAMIKADRAALDPSFI